ncbi:MAG: CCA tRNA nucleotidyltransferase [Planctomycetes bacterium]|nr:CCA tRNA nucleotidyltransferase [Planctomycetota bacterium]
MTEREFAISVVRTLQDAGFQALWAGGCVRDEMLGLVPKDYDIATDAGPEAVQKLFRRTLAIGASFGVVEILGPRVQGQHLKVQVATFRTDHGYSDGRRPDQVVFASAREDALRRDFTVNGIFFDPVKAELHDFVEGQRDLHARILRAIGDPRVRFQEDKLRLLRAVRIATRFELTIDSQTATAIQAMAGQLPIVSAERIAEELRQLLVHPRRVRGLNLLLDLGLANPILPEIIPMKGLSYGPPAAPTGDLWDHVMRVLDLIGPAPSFPLALAALLHDVGKPATFARVPIGDPPGGSERHTYHHHEHVGAEVAERIALRLKLSNAERERIVWLVEKHQYLADAKIMRPSKLKTILSHPGVHELLTLHRADALATPKSLEHVEFCERLLREWTPADLNPPALISGHDLRGLPIEAGPRYKQILDEVRAAQLDGAVTTRDDALALARRLAEV